MIINNPNYEGYLLLFNNYKHKSNPRLFSRDDNGNIDSEVYENIKSNESAQDFVISLQGGDYDSSSNYEYVKISVTFKDGYQVGLHCFIYYTHLLEESTNYVHTKKNI